MAAGEAGERILIETEVTIDAPIDVVWEALTAYDRYPEWNDYLVRVEGEARSGARVTATGEQPGRDPMVMDVEVVSVEPHHMRWEGGLPDRSLFHGDHHWELSAAGGSATHLRHYEYFSGKLARGITDANGDAIRANFERMNVALKRRAESMRAEPWQA